MFRDISCPNCGAPRLEVAADDRVVCGYCGHVFAEAGAFCPKCNHANREGVVHCDNCGETLIRTCSACQHKNWIGAEYCANCGRPLDILEYVSSRYKQSVSERLAQAREMANVIKAEEEAASQRRMNELWEIERRRKMAEAEAAARQAARDRQTMQMIVAGVVIFGIALAVAGIILALR
ncbi:MAG: zinc ribbon domain-containing protein [Chloroflexi bacterium]|nr:zinc ribbon domain-containing protein [Chloroflexota bacterium]